MQQIKKTRAYFSALALLFLLLGYLLRTLEAPFLLIRASEALCYLFGAFFLLKDMILAARIRKIEVDCLMVLAAAGAAIIGAWQEGGILLFLYSLSSVLQDYALARSRSSLSALMQLRPDRVMIREGTSSAWVALEEARPGQHMLLAPGDRVPLDGFILRGQTAVDESALTGEAIALDKQVSDFLRAGSINLTGEVEVEISSSASDSTLSRVISLVERAKETKSRVHSRLEAIEGRYAVLVILAVALYILFGILLGADPGTQFYRGMILLTVASPCALVMSVPAGILSAISSSARSGVLFKGGVHLEELARTRVLAMDKTGTLTLGRPAVIDILPEPGVDPGFLLRTAALSEARSTHPLARALREALEQVDDEGNLPGSTRKLSASSSMKGRDSETLMSPVPDNVENLAGMGIHAIWAGRSVLVGSTRLMENFGLEVPEEIKKKAKQKESEGQTVLLVNDDGQWLGLLGLSDQARPKLKEELAALRASGFEHIFVLTGDNQRNAELLAGRYGLDGFFAGLLPHEKASLVQRLEAELGPVLMVGDGINDAPALATATCGAAMGGLGSDVAIESADLVVMKDDLFALARARDLATRTRRLVIQNLSFALAVILIMVSATLFLDLSLPLGVLGHEGSTVLVTLNGLRLLIPRSLPGHEPRRPPGRKSANPHSHLNRKAERSRRTSVSPIK